jgi:hypothetical protein
VDCFATTSDKAIFEYVISRQARKSWPKLNGRSCCGFQKDDGTPWPPDLVSRRFKSAARAAGVPVLKLHEGGRHTARSLGDDAGIDPEISQRKLGHATRAMSDHYNHPEAARFRQAAEDVARYMEGAGS